MNRLNVAMSQDFFWMHQATLLALKLLSEGQFKVDFEGEKPRIETIQINRDALEPVISLLQQSARMKKIDILTDYSLSNF